IPTCWISWFICSTSQRYKCRNCEVCMGKYFCTKCKFFDDDVSKNKYHCDGCGICRTGGEQNFFHCYKYERCKSFLVLYCISVLPCGHTLHLDCLKEMETHFSKFSCPVCSNSVCDMSSVWEQLDQEVAFTPMPEIYQNKMVWILCNNCGTTSEVHFHVVAHKCLSCNS
ncbi:hypothetical protein MKW94_021032, partial [Papaver nudicaule]|nr:hypothetical protein [Papaver nudicaule]